MREDVGEVTTSLQRPATTSSRSGMPYDSFEWQQDPPPTSGVARSAWTRSHKRVSRWHRPYTAILIVLDVLSTLAASYIAATNLEKARAGFSERHLSFLDGDQLFVLFAYIVLPLGWLILLWANGSYDRRYLGLGSEEFKRVVRTSVTVVAGVSLLAFSTKTQLSRGTVATVSVCAAGFILFGRVLARQVLHITRRRTGHGAHRMVLVGTLPEALEVYTAVTRSPAAGLIPVAIHITDGYAAARGIETPVPVYAGRDILALVREVGADTIAVCGSASAEPGELRRLAWQLEGTGVDLVVAPQLTDIAGPRVHIRPIEGLPLLHVEEPTLSGPGWLTKNLLDRVAAFLGLLALSPLLAVIAIGIRTNSPGPVFFRQRRVGHEGRTFRVWKFRTMDVDAEEQKASLKELELNESDGMLFKIREDPRIFPFGQRLRATSLDELPQLINVLKGEMSLVGPRPLPADDGDYLGDVRRRLLVRPGITGLWQVSGRSDLSWDESVRLDLYYVDNWSLTYDLGILWRTIWVVLRRKGAY
jgi:exopolysaccharide biosynthesis polyprenyl glycosylphosphotransferase